MLHMTRFEQSAADDNLNIYIIMHTENMSSVESQKGVIVVQRCSVENQKGAIAVQCVYSDNALLVLNETSLNSYNVFLAFWLNWRIITNMRELKKTWNVTKKASQFFTLSVLYFVECYF